MSDVITITYAHHCSLKCTRQGQILVVHPECRNGVYFDRPPICIATGGALEEISRETA